MVSFELHPVKDKARIEAMRQMKEDGLWPAFIRRSLDHPLRVTSTQHEKRRDQIQTQPDDDHAQGYAALTEDLPFGG